MISVRLPKWMACLLVCTMLVFAARLRAAENHAQVDIALSFDMEDYLLEAADGAAKRLADMLTDRGIRATFRVVGEKARVLEERGRADVIDAVRRHDIGYHTNLHSVHPTPAEYLSECGLLDGVAEFVRREKQGAADVRRIFGLKTLSSYCQPGASWACQANIALSQIGISPVSAEIGFHAGFQGKPFWGEGVLNIDEVGQYYSDMPLYDPSALEPAKAKIAQSVQQAHREGGGLICIGYHPCDWVRIQFWDAVNFQYGANPPRDQWKAPPQRSAEETEQAFSQFTKYIDYIQSLGVRFVTATDLLAIYADRLRTEGVTEDELLQLAKQLADENITGINYQVINGKSVSPADQFELLTVAVSDLVESQQTTFPLVAKGVLGPDSPVGEAVQTESQITWPAFRATVIDVRDYLRTNSRVPPRVFIGADYVSPADFLGGLAAVWCYYAEHHGLPFDGVKLRENLALLTERHVAKAPTTPFTWSIHRPNLDLGKIISVARLQAWTLKPAIRK